MSLLLRFIAVALLTSSSAVLLGASVVAEPLDKAACLNLQSERKKLLTREMQAALDHGPDWVKDHLDTGDIDKVRQFLAIEELIEFRCRGGGVAKPTESAATGGPDIPPLPDRKPAPPASAMAEGDPETPVPDRKPDPAHSATADAKPSQTVADSDKTAPSKVKATR